MLAFVILGLRGRPWRYSALIAITVQLVGAVNLPALLYALIGPALWIPYAVWIRRDTDWPAVWRLTWRTVLLTVVASLWWAAGLVIQARYGLSILRFTESIESVSADVDRHRDPPRARLLVLLRSRPTRLLERRGHRPQPPAARDRGEFLDPAPHDDRRRGRCGGAIRVYFVVMAVIAVTIAVAASPYHDPTVARFDHQGLGHRFDGRVSPCAARRAVAAHGAQRSRCCSLVAVVSASFDALRRRGHVVIGVALTTVIAVLCIAGNPGVLARSLLQRLPRAPPDHPRATGPKPALRSTSGRTDPHPRAARRRLRRVPLGRHHRPDRARASRRATTSPVSWSRGDPRRRRTC